jgi:hypothetical protein
MMSKESVEEIFEKALVEPDLAAILEDISRFISRFIVLEPVHLTAISLWIAHTYVFLDAYTTPYLNIHSAEKRSGKTRLLEILETIVHKPWFTDRTSSAALCRKIEDTKPTLLLDESDASFKSGSEYSETLRGILNGGFRASGKVTICVGQGAGLTYRDFSIYCPKAIAGIGKLPDTVADRSIPISMKRKRTGDRVHRFRKSNYVEDSDRIREALLLWSQSTNCAAKDVSLPEELDDRQQDIWEILLQISDEAGYYWQSRARAAAIQLSTGSTELDSSGELLLRDIRSIFEEESCDRISSVKLAERLGEIEESPWGDLYGKPIDARKLAQLLRKFEIKPAVHRMPPANKTVKGYVRADFLDAWSRYIPDSNGNIGNKVELAPESLRIRVTENSSGNDKDAVLLPLAGGAITPNSGMKPANVTVVTDDGVSDEEMWEETL